MKSENDKIFFETQSEELANFQVISHENAKITGIGLEQDFAI